MSPTSLARTSSSSAVTSSPALSHGQSGNLAASAASEQCQQGEPIGSLASRRFGPCSLSEDGGAEELLKASSVVGVRLVLFKPHERDFAAAFGTIVQAGGGGLLVGGSAFFLSRRRQLATLAARHALPAISILRSFTEAGLLMSYGASQTDAYRRAGHYAGRILKGAKPADMPVELATKIDLVINFATAKALGVEIPDRLLALADEVIE